MNRARSFLRIHSALDGPRATFRLAQVKKEIKPSSR